MGNEPMSFVIINGLHFVMCFPLVSSNW